VSIHASLLPAETPRSAFGKLLESEGRIAWRAPIGLIFGGAVPVLVLVVFGNAPSMNHPVEALGGLTAFNVYFPTLIAFVLAAMALFSLPMHLATYRNQGILRRLATTPVPPAWMLTAQVIINLVLVTVAFVILSVVGSAEFGLAGPKDAGGFALALVLSVASLFAIGLWVGAIARSTIIAGAIGTVLFYPLMFTAGLYVPQAEMSSGLRELSHLSPLGASVQALQTSMQGSFPSPESLIVMVAYALVFGYLAVRFFRWN